MNVVVGNTWDRKCPVGSHARHAEYGDVTVLEVDGILREVEAVSLDENGEESRFVATVSVVTLKELDPVRDLQPSRMVDARVLSFPFRKSRS